MAKQETNKLRDVIKAAVDEAKAQGFPASVEEKEAYFLEQVSLGEQLAIDRKSAACWQRWTFRR